MILLLAPSMVRRMLASRPFRFVCQAILVALFLLILGAGLFGNRNPALTIGPILTWTIWWGGLVVLIMFAGKAWCYVCPWDAIAGWLAVYSCRNFAWPWTLLAVYMHGLFYGFLGEHAGVHELSHRTVFKVTSGTRSFCSCAHS